MRSEGLNTTLGIDSATRQSLQENAPALLHSGEPPMRRILCGEPASKRRDNAGETPVSRRREQLNRREAPGGGADIAGGSL